LRTTLSVALAFRIDNFQFLAYFEHRRGGALDSLHALITRRGESMRKTVAMSVLLAAVVSFGCGAPGEQPEVVRSAPSQTYSMEQFMETISIGGSSFNPDETKLLVSSNETGVFNVYELDLATGDRTAITDGDDTTFAVAYMPDDARILFTRDNEGDENNHLYLRGLDASVQDLTDGESTKERWAGFSVDLSKFYTLNNSREPRFMDLYEWDVATLDKRMIYLNESGFDPQVLTPDGRWLVVGKANTTNDSDLFVLDLVNKGDPLHISKHDGQANFDAEDVSVDSSTLYYTTNTDGEFATLKSYHFADGTHGDVFATNWDVSYAYFSRLGTYRVIGTNEDGYTKIRITNEKTGEELLIPNLPAGTVTNVAFSNSERLMKFTLSSDTTPGNLFLYNLETKLLKQLTDTLNPEIDPGDLVASEVVRFTARDGMTIPGPLYKPLGASADNKVPVLLSIHGGPGGQSRAGYRASRQFLLNHGYGLFAVNNRGSSGYGKTFFAADDRKHGREPLWDCVDAKEYLKTLDWVDPDRIGIMGGSYGGYMVLAALAFEPEEFAVGIDIFGVSNWIRTLKSIPPYWESFREALYAEIGDPEADEEFLYATSPVFHGDKITKPLIILQGANDPRVIKPESDDMVAAIEANDGIVEYVVFDDEGHGFTKNANSISGYEAILGFLDTHLAAESGD
jgi:dipeptidyl aminopeptidase/acylaminoacyl peptidase